MFEDKKIICRDCGSEFIFTAGEQEFFSEHGLLKEPQRCSYCRKRRKNGTDVKKSAVLYEIVCSKCGEVEKIPFEPRHDRPVFCAKCYREQKSRE